MKAKEIRDLIDFISSSGLDEVNIETQEFKISVKKNKPVVAAVTETPQAVAVQQPQIVEAPVAAPAVVATAPAAAPPPAESNNYIEIKSPMIGTFYNTPNPDADPFVKVGDTRPLL